DFVALHGGTVGVADVPGGGALLSVSLPLTAPVGTVLSDAWPLDLEIERQAAEESFGSAGSARRRQPKLPDLAAG
ncbi:hypothetical protein JZU56_03065, partial [bacterium]|nr:hypothetical protein [bacterium]